MNTSHIRFGKRVTRMGLAGVAAAVLLAGGTWLGATPGPQVVAQAAAAAPPTISHAIAGGRDSYADIVKVVAPAVVTIRTEGKAQISPAGFPGFPDDDFFGQFFGNRDGRQPRQSFRQHALGSGVIVSADGYVLTNHHVVDGADDIRVDLVDGRTLKAKVIGSDAPSDLALLKIDATNLHSLPFGDSDAVQVGDVVLAVGNPLGVGQTVTMGIVSAKGRSTGNGDVSYEDFLQTDAPINQGNSGGALVNTKGELIGINSQIVSPSGGNIGIGFAIPAKMASRVTTLLRTEGHVRRGQLGLTVQPVTSDLASSLGLQQATGAIVTSVAPGSAAERAGLKRGDVITSFNGQPVHDPNSLRNQVAEAGPGSHATLVFMRDGHERKATVELSEVKSAAARGEQEKKNASDTNFGVSVAPLTPEAASRAGLPKDLRGLIVQDVEPDSRAADAGIQPGDVIEEVNRQGVDSVDELRNALHGNSDRPLLLLVNRDGRELFLTARPS